MNTAIAIGRGDQPPVGLDLPANGSTVFPDVLCDLGHLKPFLESRLDRQSVIIGKVFLAHRYLQSEGRTETTIPDGDRKGNHEVADTTQWIPTYVELNTTVNAAFIFSINHRDDKGTETVHFLNLVDEADLLDLMDEAQVTEYQNKQAEPVTEETEPTEPEVVEPEEPVEEEKPNMLPALILVIALIGGGGAFTFMQIKKKKEQDEAEKPDPDADYVDDDEDYGYVDVDEEIEDEDTFYDEEDNEPV